MRFNVTIERDEDGMWVVVCPSIPGCVSQGATRDEAMTNIQEAIKLCLEVRAEQGLPENATSGNRGVVPATENPPRCAALLPKGADRREAAGGGDFASFNRDCKQWRFIHMHYTVQAVVRRGNESGYVAECVDIPVVTQGVTLDEVTQNLREAIELYFEGENPGEFGFVSNPPIMINMEMEPLRAQA